MTTINHLHTSYGQQWQLAHCYRFSDVDNWFGCKVHNLVNFAKGAHFHRFRNHGLKNLIPNLFLSLNINSTWAVMPLALLISDLFRMKGFLSLRWLISSTSRVSLTSLVCLAFEISLWWSLVSYETPLNFCWHHCWLHMLAWKGLAVSAKSQSLLFHVLGPPCIFTLPISTCSITWSADSPTQYLPLTMC